MNRISTILLLAILVLAPMSQGQTQISWNFTTAGPSAGTPVGNLTISDVSQGNNNGTTTLLTTTSASSGYTGATGTYNAGAAARTGVLNTAASGSAYFEFTLTPSTGYIVTLSAISFGSRSTSTGPQAYTLRSSLDSYASDLATGTLVNTSSWALKSNSSLSIVSNGGAAITFRLFGYNGTGSATASTANWRIDDLTLTVTVAVDPGLPVELTSFTAQRLGSSSLLKWATATEVNNLGFDVERKEISSSAWTKIAFVEGAGTCNSPKTYSFIDQKASKGVYAYRLKQIDKDGAFTYTEAVTVDGAAAPTVFEMLNNYPNPFNPSTEIRFTVPEDGMATLVVFNALGQEVATLYNGMAKAGQYMAATFNAAHLSSGMYVARLQFNGKSMMQKMMLAK